MTISKNLGVPVDQQDYVSGVYTQKWVDKLIEEKKIQNRAELPFIWRDEHCDPMNWHYQPSNYGVAGATLVGRPTMMLWEETEGVKKDNNIGRAVFNETTEVNRLVDDIQERGICPREGSLVYFDVDTNRTVNGTHRRRASDILGIAGWMMQGVRFDNELARIRFASLSNARDEGLPHNNSSKEDVMNSVHLVLEELAKVRPIDKKDIIREVKSLGYHLSESCRDSIRDILDADLIKSGRFESARVLVDHNNATIERVLGLTPIDEESSSVLDEDDDRDPWITDYYENDDEICLIVNVKNFQQRVGSILSAHTKAKEAGKPLHFLYCVPVLKAGKESLLSKRQKFFSTFLKGLEDDILTCSNTQLNDRARLQFAWNHPDAKHRAMPQDTKNEDKTTLIYVPNREFN
jgi:hypothetical protein|tara:strand:- start:38 stop:1255 length:1218 start_codon:yes stop_codon:yes gene_type:complete